MMQAITVSCESREDTALLAGRIAQVLRPGDCVVLAGDLGAGKTTFVKAAVAALGIDDAVTSPTFTLVHHYGMASRRVVHADLYRLDRSGELDDLGLDEARDDGAMLFVEWGDVVGAALGEALVVTFRLDDPDNLDHRVVVVSGRGERWERRWAAVEAALADWRDRPAGNR